MDILKGGPKLSAKKDEDREKELKRAYEVALMMCLRPQPLDRHERALVLTELEEAGIGLPGVGL